MDNENGEVQKALRIRRYPFRLCIGGRCGLRLWEIRDDGYPHRGKEFG